MPARRILTLIAVAAFGWLPAVARAAAPGPAIVGLDDQNPSTFSVKPASHPKPPLAPRTRRDVARWRTFEKDVHVVAARRLVPWTLERQKCFRHSTCSEDAWVREVEADGLAPELVLQGNGTTKHAPTAGLYATTFTQLLDHFEADATRDHAPPIVLWGAWNEPNEPANLVASVPGGATLAADYWLKANSILGAYCTAHGIGGCVVAAGEFADPAGCFYSPGGTAGCPSEGYVFAYGQELLKASTYPAAWAAHAFVDLQNSWRAPPYAYPQDLATECTTDLQPDIAWRERHGYAFQQSDCFVNYFAGTASNGWDMGSAWHDPAIWLDAEGAVLDNGKGLTPLDAAYMKTTNDPSPTEIDPNYPSPLGSALAAQRQADATREFLAMRSRYAGVVQRLFWFDWGPGAVGTSGFDSALFDWSDLARVPFCVFVGKPLKDCPGSTTSVRPRPSPPPHHLPPCGHQCV